MRRVIVGIVVGCVCSAFLNVASLSFAASSEVTFIARYRQDIAITLDLSSSQDRVVLDPAIAADNASVNVIENLFLGLTDLDPITNESRPELATYWETSADGLTWTFHLRDDVMWMRYDPQTASAEAVRPVVAADFVYGIKRACDPRLEGYYGGVIATVIAGCDVINQTPSEEVTDDLVFGETTQVQALDERTLEITVQRPAGYFLSMTTMGVMAAVPREAIEQYGMDWTATNNVITNGPYFVHENVRGVRRVFVRNSALPEDMWDGGNVEQRVYAFIEDGATVYALYHNNQLDVTGIPATEIQAALETQPDGLLQIYIPEVFYFEFNPDQHPFDNVHVRRAFSAIIDREAFILQFQRERAVPMIHFTPPGLLYAPIDGIGVGHDPDYAREQLALAGYPNCEGFPSVEFVTYDSYIYYNITWIEFWAAAAQHTLGCSPELFDIEQLEFVIQSWPPDPYAPRPPLPDAWSSGWMSDYPDAHNWVGDILSCNTPIHPPGTILHTYGGSFDLLLGRELTRPCAEVDDLIDQAAAETNQPRRAALYRQIEEAFFGPEGQFPIAPIFMRADYILVKPWYTGPHQTDGLFGGSHWSAYSIDMAAKLAARE